MTTESKASWVTARPEEVRAKIVDLARKGMSAEKIGLVLRDQHAIPKAKLLGLKISKILREEKLWSPSDEANVSSRISSLKKHITSHKHDYKSKRKLVKRSAQLNSFSNKR